MRFSRLTTLRYFGSLYRTRRRLIATRCVRNGGQIRRFHCHILRQAQASKRSTCLSLYVSFCHPVHFVLWTITVSNTSRERFFFDTSGGEVLLFVKYQSAPVYEATSCATGFFLRFRRVDGGSPKLKTCFPETPLGPCGKAETSSVRPAPPEASAWPNAITRTPILRRSMHPQWLVHSLPQRRPLRPFR